MTSRIGSKSATKHGGFRHARMRASGFSLVEVMIAVSVLALGTMLIQESYLRTAHLYGLYRHSFAARSWMDEKTWELREGAVYAQSPATGPGGGGFDEAGKMFQWSSDVSSAAGKDLFKVRLDVNWQEGPNPQALTKEVYVSKAESPLSV